MPETQTARPLPPGTAEALRDDVIATAREALGDDAARIAVSIVASDTGPFVRVRGEKDLVDLLEAAMFPQTSEEPAEKRGE